ncbi:MAG TPA: PilT/PilU family type 4a pilus ATPase [Gemmataceae bacterium]|nr:PilT/PilU family type 4a pilus ATPase [Gemmataceae bacterium]
MPATADDLLGQIESYHLMSAEDIAAVRARWFLPDRPEAHDATRFCEWLRASHALTDFTLNALARGRADRLTLHKYRLIDRLRAGPEAGDYLAADPLDRRVHIQIIAPALAHDPARFGRFRQVVQRAMNVLHPNVPRVLDLGHTPDVDFLVSEHIDGESLEEVLKKRGKLPPDLAVRIFVMAFDALEALHRGQLWAGELTAGCLVLTVGDKGGHGGRSVRLANFAFPKRFFDSSALNVTGQPAAAAPPPADDLLPEGPAEPEDDIARLGAAFYRCVTGWEPAPAAAPARVQELAPDVPIELADLIDHLVDPDPGRRPPTAAAVVRALRTFLKADEKAVAPAAAPVRGPAGMPAAAGNGRLSVDPLRPDEPEVTRYFRAVMRHEGSDLHLSVGSPPMARVRNAVQPLDAPVLTREGMQRLVDPIIPPLGRTQLDQSGGADFAFVVGEGEARFRVNVFKQRGLMLGLVARRVTAVIPTFHDLHLPPLLEKLCEYEQGLIIVSGVTGSGKSTTLAAMIDYINAREQVHILTIEDPIEYLFTNNKAVISQREVGIDVSDWHTALKHAVRQDPDVILVGEMRDRETFEAGITAAETGHLVFCTLHSSSAPSTIGRILDLFPAEMHPAMRQSLAFNLKAIVSLKLLPCNRPGVARIPATEVMVVNSTIRELIIRGEDKKLADAIRIGTLEGMYEFNESLRQLVLRGDLDHATALHASSNPDALKMALKGIKISQGGLI